MFLYTIDKQSENKIKQIPFTIALKSKITRNIFNQGEKNLHIEHYKTSLKENKRPK